MIATSHIKPIMIKPINKIASVVASTLAKASRIAGISDILNLHHESIDGSRENLIYHAFVIKECYTLSTIETFTWAVNLDRETLGRAQLYPQV
jgi:hypothetical protein